MPSAYWIYSQGGANEDCSAKLDFFVFPLFVSCLIYFRIKVIVLWLYDDENGNKKMAKGKFSKSRHLKNKLFNANVFLRGSFANFYNFRISLDWLWIIFCSLELRDWMRWKIGSIRLQRCWLWWSLNGSLNRFYKSSCDNLKISNSTSDSDDKYILVLFVSYKTSCEINIKLKVYFSKAQPWRSLLLVIYWTRYWMYRQLIAFLNYRCSYAQWQMFFQINFLGEIPNVTKYPTSEKKSISRLSKHRIVAITIIISFY